MDKADQLLSYYSFTRRTMKWWKRVFDVAIVNSYIMYSESLQDGRKLTHEQFRVEVASGLRSIQYTDTIPQPLRLVGKHFPTHLPPCSSGRIRQSVCVVGKKGGRKSLVVINVKHVKSHVLSCIILRPIQPVILPVIS